MATATLRTGPSVHRLALAGLATAAAGALGVALLLQYGFGFAPCSLCIYERWAYLATLLAVGLGLASGRRRPFLALAAATLLANLLISARHVAVEQGWLDLPQACVAGLGAGSIEDLRAQLMTAAPTCDQVNVVWAGLSLASWNVVTVAILLALTIAVLLRRRADARDDPRH